MDAALQIDYPGRSVQLGLFFDGRKGQAITSGSLAGKYAAVLPELCGSAWGTNYEFGRVDLGDPDYEWLWVVPDIGDASLKATYVPFSQRIAVTHTYSNDYIVGIEVMHFNGEDATDANLVRGTQKYTTVSGQTYSALYPAIYQANYNNSNTIGLYLTKNP